MAKKRNRKISTPAKSGSTGGQSKTGRSKTKNSARRAGAKQHTGLSTNLKLTIGVVVLALLGLGGVVYVANQAAPSAQASQEHLVRTDSQTLSTADDDKVTLVEFLDFECGACGALYPSISQLKSEYEGRITIVIRYFPLPSHANGDLAARAVEAAAAQGQFEPMYTKMFETQSQWGGRQSSQEELFIGFAEELGLDVPEFTATLNDPATAQRIEKDIQDGTALGVTATPTLYLNGEVVEERSYEQIKQLVDAELDG